MEKSTGVALHTGLLANSLCRLLLTPLALWIACRGLLPCLQGPSTLYILQAPRPSTPPPKLPILLESPSANGGAIQVLCSRNPPHNPGKCAHSSLQGCAGEPGKEELSPHSDPEVCRATPPPQEQSRALAWWEGGGGEASSPQPPKGRFQPHLKTPGSQRARLGWGEGRGRARCEGGWHLAPTRPS